MSDKDILRAIEVEYRAKCAAARAAYEKRMKPARKWVADAQAQLNRKLEALAAHQLQAEEEEQAAKTEARLQRDERVRVVKGKRPFQISDVPTVQRDVEDPVRGKVKVSLPRLAFLEDRT